MSTSPTDPGQDDKRVTRWQDEPLAWLVFGIPLGTIVACAVLISVASRHDDGLVVDDYYKRGLEINRVLDREASAQAQGLALEDLKLSGGMVSFRLTHARADAVLPSALDVLLAHATRSEADQALVAQLGADGHYRVEHAHLRAGPWYVDVSTPQWRLVQRVVVAAGG